MEVVLHFDGDCSLDLVERMRLISRAERRLKEVDYVGSTLSAVAFAPPIPEGSDVWQTGRRAFLSRELPKHRDAYVKAGYLAEIPHGNPEGNPEEEMWRISVRAQALNNVDYGKLVEKLKDALEPVLDEKPGVTASYTGIIPLMYRAQHELLGDLVKSFLMAFGLIALVMIVVLRSGSAGLLAMVPNLFPAVLVFGAMGWFGFLIQISSVMTAGTALGIAVDDTLHFLTWFRRGLRDGMPRQGAIRFAFGRCAGAMFSTTIICGMGLIVFMLSAFIPIAHFALLMVILLIVALLGDLVFLPAILAGPLGRVFRRPVAAAKSPSQEPANAST